MKIVCSYILFILLSSNLFAKESIDSAYILRPRPHWDKIQPLQVKSDKQSYSQTPSTPIATYKFENDSIVFPNTLLAKKIVYVEHTKDIDKILEYVFPIIMLFLGFALDRVVLYFSERQRIYKAGELWMLEINQLIFPLKNQIKNFNNFIISYCDADKEFNIPLTPIYETLKCEIFNSLYKKDLYDYLKRTYPSKAIELFHKILNIISTIKHTYETTIKYFNISQERSSQCVDIFNENLRDYIFELTTNEVEYKKELGDVFNTLAEVYNTQIKRQMPKINLFVIQKTFIAESINLLDRYDKRRCVKLLQPLFSMQDCIQELRNEKIYCKQNLQQCITMFNKVLPYITSLPKYKKRKYLHIIFIKVKWLYHKHFVKL